MTRYAQLYGGLIDLAKDEGIAEVGVVCVPKKDGRQRVVVDARVPSTHSGPPAQTELPRERR